MHTIQYRLWLLPVFMLWMLGSSYYYVCSIKNLCSEDGDTNKPVAVKEMQVESKSSASTETTKTDAVKTQTTIPITQIPQTTPEGTLPTVVPAPEVQKNTTPDSTSNTRPSQCSSYITASMKPDQGNDAGQVKKLQEFLKTNEGENIQVSGVFDDVTFEAVKRFQTKYKEDVLLPHGENYAATGFVLETTKAKINQLYCSHNQ